MSDVKTLSAFKAEYEALRLKAPTPEIRDYMDATIHDAINPALYVAAREHNDAVLARASTMYAGRGGNDPANRAGGYIEEFYIDLPARVA